MYKERRQRLLENLPDYSITIMMAGSAPYTVGDEKYPFYVNRSFYYYTGLDRENLVLMLVKMPQRTSETLFIERYDPKMAKWVGGKILPEEAKKISEVEDIAYLEGLDTYISSEINSYGKYHAFTLCGELSKQELEQPSALADLFNRIKSLQPDVTIKNIYADTTRMRLIKSDEELELMQKAIAVTNDGIKAMMSRARDNVWENELEAYFDFVLKIEQCGHAFQTICASGKNATILHYSANNCQAGEGELLLCDLGASYKYYNADISRTFPLNGKFSPRQRELYDIVLRANQMVLENACPGITTRDLNNMVLDFYAEELPKVGLLQDGKTVRDYYWHGCSHHLGLETHDQSLPEMPLEAGNVITDEPGLYIEEEGIGIRIEDDILITEDGAVCLSNNIMKDPDEIEAFMSRR